MPCLKEISHRPWWETDLIVKKDALGVVSIVERPRVLPRYRKVANQYGVCKFIRVN